MSKVRYIFSYGRTVIWDVQNSYDIIGYTNEELFKHVRKGESLRISTCPVCGKKVLSEEICNSCGHDMMLDSTFIEVAKYKFKTFINPCYLWINEQE